jgi:hypothetical protein
MIAHLVSNLPNQPRGFDLILDFLRFDAEILSGWFRIQRILAFSYLRSLLFNLLLDIFELTLQIFFMIPKVRMDLK